MVLFGGRAPISNRCYLFLPVRFDGAFHLRIHVIAFADAGLVETFRVEMNDLPSTVTVEAAEDGSCVLTARPGFDGPVTDGLKLCFRMPYSSFLAAR